MAATRAERIRQLIPELDQENTNDAQEAQFELAEDYGAEALEPLLEASPAFDDFGRLCAIAPAIRRSRRESAVRSRSVAKGWR